MRTFISLFPFSNILIRSIWGRVNFLTTSLGIKSSRKFWLMTVTIWASHFKFVFFLNSIINASITKFHWLQRRPIITLLISQTTLLFLIEIQKSYTFLFRIFLALMWRRVFLSLKFFPRNWDFTGIQILNCFFKS